MGVVGAIQTGSPPKIAEEPSKTTKLLASLVIIHF